VIALALFALLLGGQTASAANFLVKATDACGPEEVLEWSESAPKSLAKLFAPEEGQTKTTATVKRWAAAQQVKRTVTNPEIQPIAELAAARALVLMGWDHPAEIALSQLWMKSPGTKRAGVRSAAVQCLARLHRGLPSLDIAPEVREYFKRPTPELSVRDEDAIAELYIGSLLEGLGRGEVVALAEVKQAAKSLGLKTNNAGLAQALAVLANGNSEGAVAVLKKLVDQGSATGALARMQDFARLAVARSALKKGQYDRALEYFEKISPKSEWYERAAIEQAWASLSAKQYGRTVGNAYNLRNHRGFLPDTLVAASMAFLETCHYGDSREALKIFKNTYLESSFWLRDWKNKGASSEGIYALALQFVKNQNAVPSPIGYAWVSSGVFQAGQAELNKIIDEQAAIETAKSSVKSDLARDFFPGYLESLRNREGEVIARVNASLGEQTKRMAVRIRELIQDSQMVWVESLSKVGEDIAQPGRREVAEETKPEESADTWKWGKRQALGGGKDEVWKDEEGSFLADLKNMCGK